MEFLPVLFTRVIDGQDTLTRYKALMSDRYWPHTVRAVVYTRSYERGLVMHDRLRGMLDGYFQSGELTLKTYEKHDQKLLEFHLMMLDKMDRWEEFVQLFEKTFHEKKYPYPYRWQAMHLDKTFEPYVLEQIGDEVVLHFLGVEPRYRYNLIREKIAKSKVSNKLGNLRHHKQSELTEEEIERRFLKVFQEAEYDFFTGVRINVEE